VRPLDLETTLRPKAYESDRQRRNVRDRRLTPQVISLFRQIEELRESGAEKDPDAEYELRRALGLPGHAVSPTDAGLAAGEPMPVYMSWLCAGETWPKAVELRKQLLEAAARQADSDADLLPAFLASTTPGQK
jgi:hypothetical protein